MPTVIYGFDDGNNKYETLTKEQIIDAIIQAQQGFIPDLDSAFITQIKEINHGYPLRFWIGSQAEYNAIITKENNVLYIISDDNSKEEIIEAIEEIAQNTQESIAGVVTELQTKQDELTFDNTPTENSTNPVTSGGILSALNTKQDTLTFDNTPTQNSTNPVTSDGILSALNTKQNTLTFDAAPTRNSTNPVTSDGIFTAIQNSRITRTTLWEKTSTTRLMQVNDTQTLTDFITNYDYLEIVVEHQDESMIFKASAYYYTIVWNWVNVPTTDKMSTQSTNRLRLHFSANNKTVTVDQGMYMSISFDATADPRMNSTSSNTAALHSVEKIIGVKIL